MNRTVITWLLLWCSLVLMAQEQGLYQVFRVKGDVVKTTRQGRQVVRTAIQPKDVLKAQDVIALVQGSELRLVSKADTTMVVLRDQCAGSVASLINSQSSTRQSMTKQYFSFVMKSLTGKAFDEGFAAGRTTAAYRNESDSIFVSDNSGDFNDEMFVTPATCFFPVLNYSCMPYLVRIKGRAPVLRVRPIKWSKIYQLKIPPTTRTS